MGRLNREDINPLLRDSFASWPWDSDLLNTVQMHEIRDGQGRNSRRPAQDMLEIQLFNASGRLLSTRINNIDEFEHIKWRGGSIGLQVDTLGLVAKEFGRNSGRFDIKISAFRNYIYDQNSFPDDEDNPDINFNNIHNHLQPGESIEFSHVRVTEISKTRTEIRVEGKLESIQALEEFMATQYPGTLPPGGTNTSFGTTRDDKIWPVVLRKEGDPHTDLPSINWMKHIYKPKTKTLIETQEGGKILGETEKSSCIFKIPFKAPPNIVVGDELQILRSLFVPFTIPVYINIPFVEEVTGEFLRGPNLDIPAAAKTGRDTILKSFDDLTGTDASVKKKILDEYISGSEDIQLNHDYRVYDKWVHFGSAVEQLKNFRYKLQQIESYNSQSADVSTRLSGLSDPDATGSAFMLSHKLLYEQKRDNMISSFTDYEKYLYFNSSSTETEGEKTYPPSTWPKENSSRTAGVYILYPTTSSEATTWYSNQLESASLHDAGNPSMLRNTIPAYIRSDTQNDQYQLFYDMIGQHFDEMYNVIHAIEKSSTRDEDLDVGLSRDLLFDTAKSLGWTLQSGFDSGELWSYLLGTDSTGSYNNTGATYVKQESKNHGDIEKQTWKRVINNLPYLLKTKGTSRGLRALLASYGIPNTILRIDEYGGPQTSTAESRREIQKFNYALNVSGSQYIETYHGHFKADGTNGNANHLKMSSLTTPGSEYRSPSMYECRIDTSFKQSGSMIAASAEHDGAGPEWEVILEHSSSAATDHMHHNYGRLVFRISSSAGQPEISASTDYAPFFDNDWWNISFGVSEHPYKQASAPESQSFTVRYAKMGEHSDRITHSGSATVVGNSSSYSAGWAEGGNDLMRWFGKHADPSTNPTIEGFSGSVQEIRGWAEYISDDAFHKHVMAPTSIVGDSVDMAYNDLILRLPLGTDLKTYNHHSSKAGYTVTSSLPNTDNLGGMWNGVGEGGKFVNFTDSIPYSNKSETYYVDVPHTAGPRATSNKVRIETTSLRGNQLSRTRSFESSSHQSNPLDTDEVTVALSPADQIDTDISMQFGGFALADYIGDPRDTYLHEYTSLRDTRNKYFKKFSNAYNVWAFIKLLSTFNTGLFKQIESMLPGRADGLVGIIIRPNLLERHKLNQPVSMSQETMYHTGSITETKLSGSVSGEMPSVQQYIGSTYGTLTAPINTGVRSSQQGASGSGTYVNRFNEGSEYLKDVYGETTMSSVQTFVSRSRTMRGVEKRIQVPTFNLQNEPLILNSNQQSTGSGWFTVFNDDFTTFVTSSRQQDRYGYSTPGQRPRSKMWSTPQTGSGQASIVTGGVQLGNDTATQGNEWWAVWNDPIKVQPHSLYRIEMVWSQSADTGGDADTYFGVQLFQDGQYKNVYAANSRGSSHYIGATGLTISTTGGLRKTIAYFHSNDKHHRYASSAASYGNQGADELDRRLSLSDINGVGYVGVNPTGSNEMTQFDEFSPLFIVNYNDDDGRVHIKNINVKAIPDAFVDVQPNYIASPAQRRLVYEGCRMSSNDWNVGSPQTIDGGPVVEFIVVNPNTLRVKGGKGKFIDNQVIDRRFVQDARSANRGGAAAGPGDTFVN